MRLVGVASRGHRRLVGRRKMVVIAAGGVARGSPMTLNPITLNSGLHKRSKKGIWGSTLTRDLKPTVCIICGKTFGQP